MTEATTYLYRVGTRNSPTAAVDYGDGVFDEREDAEREANDCARLMPPFDDVWIERAPLGAWERLP